VVALVSKPSPVEDVRLDRQVRHWAALRCHPSQTLDLVDQLAPEGLTGWTPRIKVHRRLPRTRKSEVRIAALLPSYVFIALGHADRSLDLGIVGKVPRCWPFTFNGHRPVLPVEQLEALEMAATMRPDALDRSGAFSLGQLVSVLYGPLRGHTGPIIARKGRDRWIVDMRGTRVQVPSFLLQPFGHINAAG
jgi:hypothetical protein